MGEGSTEGMQWKPNKVSGKNEFFDTLELIKHNYIRYTHIYVDKMTS